MWPFCLSCSGTHLSISVLSSLVRVSAPCSLVLWRWDKVLASWSVKLWTAQCNQSIWKRTFPPRISSGSCLWCSQSLLWVSWLWREDRQSQRRVHSHCHRRSLTVVQQQRMKKRRTGCTTEGRQCLRSRCGWRSSHRLRHFGHHETSSCLCCSPSPTPSPMESSHLCRASPACPMAPWPSTSLWSLET